MDERPPASLIDCDRRGSFEQLGQGLNIGLNPSDGSDEVPILVKVGVRENCDSAQVYTASPADAAAKCTRSAAAIRPAAYPSPKISLGLAIASK